MPQQYLDSLDPNQRGEDWQGFFEQGRPGEREALLVVDLGGRVVGFVNVGPSRDEDASGVGEVRAIYLLPEQWGRGLGRGLMAAALTLLEEFGFGQVILWVLDANVRAQRFYEAGGWILDGATKSDDRWGFPIAEVRYRRRLP